MPDPFWTCTGENNLCLCWNRTAAPSYSKTQEHHPCHSDLKGPFEKISSTTWCFYLCEVSLNFSTVILVPISCNSLRLLQLFHTPHLPNSTFISTSNLELRQSKLRLYPSKRNISSTQLPSVKKRWNYVFPRQRRENYVQYAHSHRCTWMIQRVPVLYLVLDSRGALHDLQTTSGFLAFIFFFFFAGED